MTSLTDGPTETEADTTDAATSRDPLPGFADALGVGHQPVVDGEPDEAEAVVPTEDDAPAETPDEPTADAEGDADPGDAAEPDETPNFDGFSDAQKTTFERLFEAGHVTAEEIDTARKESMFQSNYTKKTMTLADERKEAESKFAEREDDLKLLDTIRSDDALHDKWLKMQAGDEVDSDDVDGDELVDRRTVAEIAAKAVEDALAKDRAQRTTEQTSYEQKKDALEVAASESMALHEIDVDTIQSYLQAEIALLPPGTDAVLAVSPEELQRRVAARHELVTAKAEAASLRGKLQKRTSKDGQTAKQSSSPSPRVSDSGGDLSPKAAMERDLGVDSAWSNVTGFGHRDAR